MAKVSRDEDEVVSAQFHFLVSSSDPTKLMYWVLRCVEIHSEGSMSVTEKLMKSLMTEDCFSINWCTLVEHFVIGN